MGVKNQKQKQKLENKETDNGNFSNLFITYYTQI